MKGFKGVQIVAVAAATLILAGCASGPRFAAMQGTIPNIAANSGRLYVYRPGAWGVAVQPNVIVNGAIVGRAVPDGFFYIDRPSGTYTITIATSTEPDRPLTLTLAAGEARYVRLDVDFGWWLYPVYPTLVDGAEGMKDIQNAAPYRPGRRGRAGGRSPGELRLASNREAGRHTSQPR